MSDIEFDCPECGGLLVVNGKGAGAIVKCTLCSKPIRIPYREVLSPAGDVKVTCPYCAQHIEVPKEMVGQTAECPACKRWIKTPSPTQHDSSPPTKYDPNATTPSKEPLEMDYPIPVQVRTSNVPGSPSTTEKPVLAYHWLRALFLIGFALAIVLWFVPFGTTNGGGEEKTFSMLSMVRFLSLQDYGLGMLIFYVSVFALNIVFFVLGLVLPRRWVFITASSVVVFFALLNLFTGSDTQVTFFIIPRVLSWSASFLAMLGFVIKPPVEAR